MNKTKRGFTLIELLVVIAIIGLVSTIAVVALNSARTKAANSKKNATVVQYAKALEMAYDASTNKGYAAVDNSTAFRCLGIYNDGFCWAGATTPHATIPRVALTPFMALPEQDGENLMACNREGYIYRCLQFADAPANTRCVRLEIVWEVRDRSAKPCGPGKLRTIDPLTGAAQTTTCSPDGSRCHLILEGK